jgi:hypothetical protein
MIRVKYNRNRRRTTITITVGDVVITLDFPP